MGLRGKLTGPRRLYCLHSYPVKDNQAARLKTVTINRGRSMNQTGH